MRQNRVDPMGDLHAVPKRGALMGNRGVLHDADGRIRRGWQGRRWIACLIAFRGRRRQVMAPGRYTELFFLDEATAYAAGHRPCAECRRAEYRAFVALWTEVHGRPKGSVADGIDRALHAARIEGTERRLWQAEARALPPGTMIRSGAGAALVTVDGLRPWSFGGYGAPGPLPDGPVEVITPTPVVALFAAGLVPGMAGQAGSEGVPPKSDSRSEATTAPVKR
ncbi:hypothetical protein [Litorisediminicola beolgyonensis]|uniref:Metal binding domain of Ada n=1 Tax=Litorisediminicola beolgyonensis TaxID=1173614 RepID=A0ABW3ZP51_9RHOB